MDYPFRNLVFEGGGVKGIAYGGALQGLEDRGILDSIVRVGGTSAGAINAVLLACGYTLDETLHELEQLDFKKFLDDSFGVVRDFKRLKNQYGWYRGDAFKDWIGDLIKRKTGSRNIAFKQFQQRGFLDLHLIGTNLSTRYAEVFSAETTPKLRIIDAVRISMSIPLYFTAVRRPKKGLYVDGGLSNNYPIKLFDRFECVEPGNKRRHAVVPKYYAALNKGMGHSPQRRVYNKETLGFRLDDKDEIEIFRNRRKPKQNDIDGFFGYTEALVKSVLNVQNNQHLHSDDWQRTVYIDTLRVKTTDFDISDKKKKELVDSGKKGIDAYFHWYDNAPRTKLPRNHPDYVEPKA